jgi:hypothetical protein
LAHERNDAGKEKTHGGNRQSHNAQEERYNMNTNRMTDFKTRVFSACLEALLVGAMLTASPASNAQTTPANLSPDLQEIVKLAQAHMGDDVILSYIKNTGKVYNLSGDDMIYLGSQGISQPVISALLQTKSGAPALAPTTAPPPYAAPATAPPPAYAPTPAPAYAPASAPAYAPPPGLVDVFSSDAGLNPSVWMMQTPLLQGLAQQNGSVSLPSILNFGPAGMLMSGVNGPGQFTGIQSAGAYMAPFTLTATVSGSAMEGIPFEVYLVSPDFRQWLSVAGHLGGAGRPREGITIRTPFGGIREGGGGGPSPEHGVWVNWTGSAQPISALGTKIYPAPVPSVPYTITMTVGADGMAAVSLQDPSGVSLGALNAMPVGTGPFNVVLAAHRAGPTFASWQSVQLTPMGAPAMTAPPPTPTLDYFQAHLTPYGQWMDVPGIGPAWVPLEANAPGWRPYMDAGRWEYTDAGWYWQSDYAWGDIGFHYGRWINNGYTGGRWAWAPGYDWAPSWVAWREGEGAMGWAPLPWGVEYRAGLGLYWHGGLVAEGGVGIDFGLGFDAFVFVGPDHFWGGDYRRNAFGPERAREFYNHSTFHAGYRMEGGHLRAEGLGRDHIAAVTHHAVVEHKAAEIRRTEETHDFAKRTEEHHDLARARVRTPARVEPGRGPASPERGTERPPERTTGAASERGGTPGTPGHPGSTTTPGRGTVPGSKPSGSGTSSEKKPEKPE